GKTATSGGFSRKNFYLIIRISICNHAEFLVYWIGYFRRAGDTGPGRLFRRRTAGPEWAAGRGAFRPGPLPLPPRPTYGKTSSIITCKRRLSTEKGRASMQSVSDIWSMILARLREDLSETTIKTWFDDTTVVALEGDTLVLHCPNDFKRTNIQDRFL